MQLNHQRAYLNRFGLDNWVLNVPRMNVVCYNFPVSNEQQCFFSNVLKAFNLSLEIGYHQSMPYEALLALAYGERNLLVLIDCPDEIKVKLSGHDTSSCLHVIRHTLVLTVTKSQLLSRHYKKELFQLSPRVVSFMKEEIIA